MKKTFCNAHLDMSILLSPIFSAVIQTYKKLIYFIVFLFVFIPVSLWGSIVINEVMPYTTDDYYNEYIELYNYGTENIDLTGWKFTDGYYIDDVVAWNTTTYGVISDTNVICDTTILPAGRFAVILDKGYPSKTQPYDFSPKTIIFTTNDSTLGNGLSKTDPITLYNSSGAFVSSYGTPIVTNSSTYGLADDDGLDTIPLYPTKDISIERIDPSGVDTEINWAKSINAAGCTPGSTNSVTNTEGSVSTETSRTFLGVISEVMPAPIATEDWIELFVLDSSGTIEGCSLYEGNNLLKTFPDVTPIKGDHIVIHFNSSKADETTDKGANGYWDWYTTDTGITATDNTITIKDKAENIVDILCYANNDGTWSSANETLFTEARSTGSWIAAGIGEIYCAEWNESSSQSISRKTDDSNNWYPLDTNTADNWTIENPTIGIGYGHPPPPPPPTNIFLGVISEVMPAPIATEDWIELFVLDSSGTIEGCSLYEGNNLLKTFPDVTPIKGDHIVIHFNSSKADEITNKGANGYWDWYTTDTGITATDNIITIKDEAGNIVDILCYANNDGTWSSANETLFTEARSTGSWIAAGIGEEYCVIWDGSKTRSLARKSNSSNHWYPIDTNTTGDWIIADHTMGSGYGIPPALLPDENVLQGHIFPKQFSPYRGTSRATRISYTASSESTIRITIYDVQGRQIRFLKEEKSTFGEVEWDGRDDNGIVLPVGIYIVLFECTEESNGKRTILRKLVVIGKEL